MPARVIKSHHDLFQGKQTHIKQKTNPDAKKGMSNIQSGEEDGGNVKSKQQAEWQLSRERMMFSMDTQTQSRKIQVTSGCNGANCKAHGGGGEGLQTCDAHEPHKPVPQCANDMKQQQSHRIHA